MKPSSSAWNVARLALLAGSLMVILAWAMLHRQRDMSFLLALARRDFPNVPRIQVADLQAWLSDERRPTLQLFDVRTEEEYAVSRLPGAQRMPPNARAKAVRAALDPARTGVFYCSVGYRSSALVSALVDAGITNVVNLEGSIFAWANQGLPLEKPGTKEPTKLVHPFSESYASLLKSEHAAKVPFIENTRNEIAVRQRLRIGLSIGLLVLFLTWETLAPMYGWFKQRLHARVEHGLRNFVLGLLNTLIVALSFVNLWLWATHWAQDQRVGLLNWMDPPEWARAVIALLVLDGWMYAWHRLNHGVPILWRFHRVHHSEPHLDVTSATRFHLGEIAISALLRVPVILLFGLRFPEIVIYESVMFAVVQFHHANIRLPERVENVLSKIIVTPNFHRVHHSKWQPETDSNFSSLLSVWDRVFGTRRTCADLQKLELGLDEFGPEDENLARLLESPLQEKADPS